MPKRLLLGCSLEAESDGEAAGEWLEMVEDCERLLNAAPATVLAGRNAAVLLAPVLTGNIRLKVDHNLEPDTVLIDAWRPEADLD